MLTTSGSMNLYSQELYVRVKWKCESLSHVWLIVIPWTVAQPGPSVHGMGCHFLLQGLFPTQGSNLVSHIVGRFPSESPGKLIFSSVQSLSRVRLCDPLNKQHARPPCPSPTPRVYPDSCPSSRWCHPAISSSVIPFSSCPQSLPEWGSFPMSQLFAWGGQSTGVSALASFLPKNTQDWSPLECTGWISLQSKGPSGVFSNTTVKQLYFTSSKLFLEHILPQVSSYTKLMQLSKDLHHKTFCSKLR